MVIRPSSGVLKLIRISSGGKDLCNQGVGIKCDSGDEIFEFMRWVRRRRRLSRHELGSSCCDQDHKERRQNGFLKSWRITHSASCWELADILSFIWNSKLTGSSMVSLRLVFNIHRTAHQFKPPVRDSA